jgi:hypothetical protein
MPGRQPQAEPGKGHAAVTSRRLNTTVAAAAANCDVGGEGDECLLRSDVGCAAGDERLEQQAGEDAAGRVPRVLQQMLERACPSDRNC